MRRHLIGEHNGRLDNSVRRSSTSSRSRSPDRRPAPAEHFRLDAYSSEEEPPQDAESIRTGRAAYVPRRVYEAPTHTEPIAFAQPENWSSSTAATKGRTKGHFWQQASFAQGNPQGSFFGTGKSRYSEEITATSKISYSDSECIRVQGASARFEQGRTQKQIELKPATIRVHRQAATAAGR